MSERKKGRPKSRQDGLKVFTARMTPKAKARLQALAQVKGQHAYLVLEELFWKQWALLESDERKAAETVAATIERATKIGRS